MFRSIIVPIDLSEVGDRALPFAVALGEVGKLPVELVTVSSPGIEPAADAFELRRRAAEYGVPAEQCTILYSNEAASALIEHAASRDDPLVVMATTAKGRASSRVFGSVTTEVLRRYGRPVLLVGPRVTEWSPESLPTPVACVEASDLAAKMVPTVVDWVRTFHGPWPWAVEVLPAGLKPRPDVVETALLKRFADRLASQGVSIDWDVMHGRPTESRLEEFADRLENAMFVTTSWRWTDEHPHWHSTTRRLAHRSRHPVLVVPATDQPSMAVAS